MSSCLNIDIVVLGPVMVWFSMSSVSVRFGGSLRIYSPRFAYPYISRILGQKTNLSLKSTSPDCQVFDLVY